MKSVVLSLDWETRSTINLPATGPYVYAMHPTTDIILGAWAFIVDGVCEDPTLWRPGMQVPQRIIDHVKAGGEIRAHNAAFERLMWKYVAGPRYGWPEARLEQFHCTAAEAAAMTLPRSLGQLAGVLKIEAQKDNAGHNLMMRMCKPRSYHADGTPVWWEDEGRISRLGEYCIQDVRTEMRAAQCLRRLTPHEREVYLMTERKNDRGIQVDVDLIQAAKDVAQIGIDRANERLREVTSGVVTEVTKIAAIKKFLESEGVVTNSIGKARMAELLDEDLPEAARKVLEIRASAGRSSVAKLSKMQVAVCEDGRARGLTLYHGAGTGRESGKLIQPHNFPRGEVADVDSYIDLVMDRDYDRLDLFAHPIIVVSSMLRSMITAAPGHELIAADFSAIEARVLNWIAGQQDVVEMFRAIDRGDKSKDPYKVMAMRMGRAATVAEITKEDRQAGKAAELGCGFQMGWSKFMDAAWAVYQVRVDEQQAKDAVAIYRGTHPYVVDLWYSANDAVMGSVAEPGKVFKFGALKNIKVVTAGAYLYIVLPSGRPLCYPGPKIVDGMTPWGEMKPGVEFSGVNSVNRQWERQRLYGGLIVENVVQAIARDLLIEGAMRAEAWGYPHVLAVHDEAVAEVPEGFGSVKEFETILAELPEWAAGCPVSAEGWRGFRYRK